MACPQEVTGVAISASCVIEHLASIANIVGGFATFAGVIYAAGEWRRVKARETYAETAAAVLELADAFEHAVRAAEDQLTGVLSDTALKDARRLFLMELPSVESAAETLDKIIGLASVVGVRVPHATVERLLAVVRGSEKRVAEAYDLAMRAAPTDRQHLTRALTQLRREFVACAIEALKKRHP